MKVRLFILETILCSGRRIFGRDLKIQLDGNNIDDRRFSARISFEGE